MNCISLEVRSTRDRSAMSINSHGNAGSRELALYPFKNDINESRIINRAKYSLARRNHKDSAHQSRLILIKKQKLCLHYLVVPCVHHACQSQSPVPDQYNE